MDASFLYMETPSMHTHVCLAAVLDPSTMPVPYSFEVIRDRVEERVPLIAPFRRVLREVPMRLHHPVWADDPDFDIERHVHRAELPSPGSIEQFAEHAAAIASIPLDRSRPLWDMTVVEGLPDGRLGLVIKVHHSAMDGSAGIEILYALFDLEVEAHETPTPPPRQAPSFPTDLELVVQAAGDRLRANARVGGLIRRTGDAISQVVRGRSSSDGPSGGTPLVAPQTPFNGAIGPERSMAFAQLSLTEVKEVKSAFGMTVNDVVLATCARTLRRYLQARDCLPDVPLLASCPVSIRTADESGQFGNRVSVMFSRLHAEVADPTDCLRATAEAAAAAKVEQRQLGSAMLGDWAEIADPRSLTFATDVLTRFKLADRLPPVHNVVVSNVPGPGFPVYLAGAKLEQAYPMGPVLEGAGLNITVLSYCDSVDVGFIAATNLVPDLDDLADQVEPAFAELLAAARSAR
ncbi:MAG TPA: wax ester/triacylglycerol synthase family O-acyltransferase [Acidimicrobiales bacterium]